MLIIENERFAGAANASLNEFKPAFVRQSKQPFGIALPIVPEPCLSVKIIAAEAVIYVFKARRPPRFLRSLPRSIRNRSRGGGGFITNHRYAQYIVLSNYTVNGYRWQCVRIKLIRCKKVIFCCQVE